MKDILLPMSYFAWLRREVRAEMFAYGETFHEAIRNLRDLKQRRKRMFGKEYQEYMRWHSDQSKSDYLGQGDDEDE